MFLQFAGTPPTTALEQQLADIAETAMEYTQQANVPQYTKATMFETLVPYVLRGSNFSTKSQALKSIMTMLSKPPIMDAMLNGQVIPLAGDRFMWINALAILQDPVSNVVTAMRAADPATLNVMVQYVRNKGAPSAPVPTSYDVFRLVRKTCFAGNGALLCQAGV
jgi:hypothetical protein